MAREKAKQQDPAFAQAKRERELRRYHANPEAASARNKAWREVNGAGVARERRERYAQDPAFRTEIIEGVKAHRAANPEAVKASQAKYHAKNRDARNAKSRAYRIAHLDQVLALNRKSSRAHYQAHPEYYKVKTAGRRAVSRSATPAWADKAAMMEIVRRCRERTRQTGVQMSVDHCVPLKGRNAKGELIVCGLHWEGNMTIMPLAQNKSKNNRRWKDMP